jgi:hypothetical protein
VHQRRFEAHCTGQAFGDGFAPVLNWPFLFIIIIIIIIITITQ